MSRNDNLFIGSEDNKVSKSHNQLTTNKDTVIKEVTPENVVNYFNKLLSLHNKLYTTLDEWNYASHPIDHHLPKIMSRFSNYLSQVKVDDGTMEQYMKTILESDNELLIKDLYQAHSEIICLNEKLAQKEHEITETNANFKKLNASNISRPNASMECQSLITELDLQNEALEKKVKDLTSKLMDSSNKLNELTRIPSHDTNLEKTKIVEQYTVAKQQIVPEGDVHHYVVRTTNKALKYLDTITQKDKIIQQLYHRLNISSHKSGMTCEQVDNLNVIQGKIIQDHTDLEKIVQQQKLEISNMNKKIQARGDEITIKNEKIKNQRASIIDLEKMRINQRNRINDLISRRDELVTQQDNFKQTQTIQTKIQALLTTQNNDQKTKIDVLNAYTKELQNFRSSLMSENEQLKKKLADLKISDGNIEETNIWKDNYKKLQESYRELESKRDKLSPTPTPDTDNEMPELILDESDYDDMPGLITESDNDEITRRKSDAAVSINSEEEWKLVDDIMTDGSISDNSNLDKQVEDIMKESLEIPDLVKG